MPGMDERDTWHTEMPADLGDSNLDVVHVPVGKRERAVDEWIASLRRAPQLQRRDPFLEDHRR
jgi:hypothetical protein